MKRRDALTVNVSPLVYDAGALIAVERNDKSFLALHEQALREKRLIAVPHCVIAQVWRDGSRQAVIARLLRGCQLEPTSLDLVKQAGLLLGRSGTRDAVDAIVVATALLYRAMVVTSDPTDLKSLLEAAELHTPLPVITI